ncbi:MAG: hypothetical protein COA32_04720 [Fluviicola sp.]|nr:MAG: hypothetical protein COA32_04720 [Fluviicola sp.]
MKFLIFISILAFPLLSFTQTTYEDSLKQEREAYKEKILQSDELLNEKEQLGIESLEYFKIDTSWVLEGTLIKDKGKKFKMQTSTERQPTYRRYGWVCLERNGQKFRLAVYKNLELKDKKYKHYLFLPFKDANAPGITYGAGRYIELYKEKGSKDITVDFNTSFNPYCVYSYRYSCPVTPSVNHIDFVIEAGERNPTLRKTD